MYCCYWYHNISQVLLNTAMLWQSTTMPCTRVKLMEELSAWAESIYLLSPPLDPNFPDLFNVQLPEKIVFAGFL